MPKPQFGTYIVTEKKDDPPTHKFEKGVSPMITIEVRNPAKFYRNSETVEASIDASANNFAVMDGISSRILDSQVYASEAGHSPDKLLFQVDLAPSETRTFYILDAAALPAEPPPIVKTFARYVPERYDDFAWESDRIAFRAYTSNGTPNTFATSSVSLPVVSSTS